MEEMLFRKLNAKFFACSDHLILQFPHGPSVLLEQPDASGV